MLTFVLITSIFSTPVQPSWPAAPPREGYEAAVSPKGVMPAHPERQRRIFGDKVETAWLLADGVSARSEPEACP